MNLSGTSYGPWDPPETDDGPYCPACGTELEWVDYDACGGEGKFDAYDDDPMWYDPGDTEDCQQCDGNGGWWFCPNRDCEQTAIQKVRA